MKIIADSAIPFLRGVFEPWAEVEYLAGSQITASIVRDAQALVVRTRTQCNSLLLGGSSVEILATATIGFDHIDTLWCGQNGIQVATAAGCNARGVLQWIGAALVFLSQKQGWQPHQITLGVVGVGHVGSLVAHYAREWGFRVLCCDPPRQMLGEQGLIPLDELVAQSDIITLHTPLDSSTYHMVDEQLLSRAKPSATIINTSRGSVVDSAALRTTSHPYLLDVWEGEPQLDPPLVEGALVATPHIAGYSLQGKAVATAMAVEALARHFDLPLVGWYPPQITRSIARPISWSQLCQSLPKGYDIAAQSGQLKADPSKFETLRDNYDYRIEYF